MRDLALWRICVLKNLRWRIKPTQPGEGDQRAGICNHNLIQKQLSPARVFWGGIMTIIFVEWLILVADGIWIIYRIVKGWLRLNDNHPMYTA